VLRLRKKIQICVCVFTFSLKLEKWSFHVADLPRTGKKCTEIIKAREGRAKLLFCFIKYAKFVSGKKSFSYDGAKVWNSIPENLRNCKSVSSFKAEIATHSLF